MSAPNSRFTLLLALATCAIGVSAAPDISTLLPAEDGWLSLSSGPDWAVPRAPSKRRAKPTPVPTEERSTAQSASGSDGPVGEVAGAASTGGYVGLAGEPLQAPDTGPTVPDLPGVRYRVLSAGDETKPDASAVADAGHAWLRLSARRLDGIPVGPQRMADNTGPAMTVQRMAWSALPSGLAAAVKRMPYHARWEIYVEHPLAQGRHGLFSVSRARPTIFDVERLPPAAAE